MRVQDTGIAPQHRYLYIGESLTEEDVKAKFEDGVLTLDFPKEKAIKLPERKTIQIEG